MEARESDGQTEDKRVVVAQARSRAAAGAPRRITSLLASTICTPMKRQTLRRTIADVAADLCSTWKMAVCSNMRSRCSSCNRTS